MSTRVSSDFKLHTNKLTEYGTNENLNMVNGCVYYEPTWVNYSSRDTSVTYNGNPTLKLSLEYDSRYSPARVYAEETLKPKFSVSGNWYFYYRFYFMTDAPASALGSSKSMVGASTPGSTSWGGTYMTAPNQWFKHEGASGSSSNKTNVDVFVAARISGETPYNVWIADLYAVLFDSTKYSYEQLQQMSDEELLSTFNVVKQVIDTNTHISNIGVETSNIVENQYITTPDGSKFLKIFSHDVSNNSKIFENNEDAKFDVAASNRFSRLEDVPLFTSNDVMQVGVSGIQSRVDGTYYWFGFGNQSSKNVICNIKVVLTKNDGTEDILQYNGFNIEAKKMYYAQLPETTYNYANIYFDDDYDYFIWSSSFSQGFYLTYGWGKSESILFTIGSKLNYLIPSYTSLGISENDFWLVNKPKYEFLLNYQRNFTGQLKVPGTYQELEYIEANGTQYINTGFVETNTWTCDCKFYNPSANNNYLYGGRQNSNSYLINGLYSNSTFEYNWYALKYEASSIVEMTQRIEGSNIRININGSEYFVPVASGTNSNNVFIFACNNSSIRYYAGTLRLYYFKMYNNNTLVRDFIPVIRITDNVVGLYDAVNRTFYTNQGSGSFIPGPYVTAYNRWNQTANPLITDIDSSAVMENSYTDRWITMSTCWNQGICKSNQSSYLTAQLNKVNGNTLPQGYTRLSYIRSTGSQYINLGYIPTINTVIQGSFRHTENIIDTPLFGVRKSDYSNSYTFWTHPIEYSAGYPAMIFNGNQVDFKTKYNVGVPQYFYYSKSIVRLANQVIYTPNVTSGSPNLELILFGLSNGGSIDNRKFVGDIHSFRISNNSTIVKDLVPVIENSTGVVGMYDIVQGIFHTNAGTGLFIPGYDDWPSVDIGCYNPRLQVSNAYDVLSYIESYGSQYIDTGVLSGDIITKIEADYCQNTNDARQIIFGMATPSDSHYSYIGYCEGNTDERVIWYNTGVSTGISFNSGFKHLSLTANGKAFTYTINNNTVNATSAISPGGTTPYYLFGDNSAGTFIYGCKIKLQSFKIWGNGNTLIRDFIPVRERLTGIIGLYDLVNNKFYTNKGSGSFGGGDIITGIIAPDGTIQQLVELYTRVDNVNGWTGKASIRNNKCIFMDEFIEE